MSEFLPEKLFVKLIPPATTIHPIIGRKYTLTHSDETGQLFLDVGYIYNYDAVNWQKRDEVLAEWLGDERGSLWIIGSVDVDGPELNENTSAIRFNIFQKEMNTALSAMVNGDIPFFRKYPALLNTPIFIRFQSIFSQYSRPLFFGESRNYISK